MSHLGLKQTILAKICTKEKKKNCLMRKCMAFKTKWQNVYLQIWVISNAYKPLPLGSSFLVLC